MGTDGCVSFQFKHCGQLLFAPGTDEDSLMEAALEAGAEDVLSHDDGSFEVITRRMNSPTSAPRWKKSRLQGGYGRRQHETAERNRADRRRRPAHAKLLDALESLDDVRDVFTSAVMDEEA